MNEEQAVSSQVVQEVSLPISQLVSNAWNRKTFDPKGSQELLDSIKAKGILEPLTVRKIAEDKYEIASGERRWRAAVQAGLHEVPCRVLDLKDEDVQDMNLISNIQREDLSALEKASMVKARMESGGITQIQIAKKLGKSDAWVGELLGFLKLPDKVHESVTGLPMNTNQLRAIAALPNAEYQEQIAQELQAGKIKPEHVEQRAHQLHNGFKASMAKRAKKNQTTDADKPAGDRSSKIEKVVAQSGTTKPISEIRNSTSATPVSVGSIATAVKDNVADAVLPQFGHVGTVMKQGLDKAWKGPKTGLFKWGLILMLVGWMWHPVLKTINYVFTRLMHVEVNQAINSSTVPSVSTVATDLANAPRKFTEAMLSPIAAPTGMKPEMLAQKRVRFTWNAVPNATGYNFYSAPSWSSTYYMETKKPTTDLGVIWHADDGAPGTYKFVVTALDGQGHESPYSEPVEVELQ